MKVHDKLKKLIFKKLYKDLSNVEIIPYKDSIWFIDRENKYWYLEYEKGGKLWWRYGFFQSFFSLFSLEVEDYQSVISEWVEEVLNCKVDTPWVKTYLRQGKVEEVLNFKVDTPLGVSFPEVTRVEEVLNFRVDTPRVAHWQLQSQVEEVLNCKVKETIEVKTPIPTLVGEVLGHSNS